MKVKRVRMGMTNYDTLNSDQIFVDCSTFRLAPDENRLQKPNFA
jgi:hypothetical protein